MIPVIARLLLRSLIAAGLLTWLTLSQSINWLDTLSRLAGIRPVSLVIAVAAVGVSHVLAIESVRRLLRSRGLEVRFTRLLSNHFRGLFATQFLPTPVAGDIVRVHDLHSGPSTSVPSANQTEGAKPVWQSAAWALTVQRALNLVVSLLIFIATVQAAQIQDLAVFRMAAASILLAVACGFALLSWIPRLAAIPVLKRVSSWTPPSRAVLQTLAFGIAQQTALIVAVLAAANGLGMDVSTSRLIAAVPLSLLAVILPISVSGLGVRESVYVFVLAPAGVSASDAVTLSLSIFGLALTFSLIGLATPGRASSESDRELLSPALAGSQLKDQPTS
ncbi:MAG: lysylphosphatidylglycerol synthase transmembrane domain-containing protein [Planctomycetota bacterium]|jgi:uncharacterized membrane protein YbhN (UPF0104 family)